MAINSITGNTLLSSGSFPPVRAASTGSPLNPATGGLIVVDGVQLVAGDRVLCKDETNAVNNGIYSAATGPWTRTSDASGNAQFYQGMTVTAGPQGAVNGGQTFVCTCTDDPVVVGTSLITWASQQAVATAQQTATSTTSLTIGTGSKTFATQSGKAFQANQWVLAQETSNSANQMLGQITSYSGGSLVVDVVATGGSGTISDWTIVLTNSPAAAGYQPPVGSGNVTGPGSSVAGHVATFADATGKVLQDGGALAGAINLINFGADPTGVNDCSTALSNAYAAAVAAKKALYVPAGTYRVSSQITWSLAANPTFGVTVYGDGPRLSLFQFDSSVASPNLQIVGNASQAIFYSRFSAFGVEGNVNGIVLQIGRTDLTDELNQFVFDQLEIKNSNSSAAAIGTQVNNVIGGTFLNVVSNGGGSGTGLAALELQQASFCTFLGGSFGNSTKSVYITNGFTFSCTFFSVDTEAATTAWTCDSVHAANNTWVGGQIATVTNGFNFTAGNSALVINPNFSVLTTKVLSGTGLTVKRPGDNFISTPPVPGSGTPVTNTTSMVAVVTVYGGTFTQVAWNTAIVTSSTTTTIVLNPGDQITLTYSVAPSWLWTPLYT
jgi:Pectate lyase superfamily protein